MSAQEILAELPHLSRTELHWLDARLHELLKIEEPPPAKPWGAALLEIAGTAQGLPADFARNHDHYVHGTPKR
jgi:hypothetical protein